MLSKLEGFQYATSIEFNTGYYHIRLRESESKLCMIILQWGKYRYKCLSMVLSNFLENFPTENE